jgi:hypothetical protein
MLPIASFVTLNVMRRSVARALAAQWFVPKQWGDEA